MSSTTPVKPWNAVVSRSMSNDMKIEEPPPPSYNEVINMDKVAQKVSLAEQAEQYYVWMQTALDVYEEKPELLNLSDLTFENPLTHTSLLVRVDRRIRQGVMQYRVDVTYKTTTPCIVSASFGFHHLKFDVAFSVAEQGLINQIMKTMCLHTNKQ